MTPRRRLSIIAVCMLVTALSACWARAVQTGMSEPHSFTATPAEVAEAAKSAFKAAGVAVAASDVDSVAGGTMTSAPISGAILTISVTAADGSQRVTVMTAVNTEGEADLSQDAIAAYRQAVKELGRLLGP